MRPKVTMVASEEPVTVPNPAQPPSGCRFHPRCFMAQPICSTEDPPLREIAPGHLSACHFAEQVPAASPLVDRR